MGLNISKGNMYEFVTHTWNAIKGQCFHDCSYCYMKRYGELRETYLDTKEFKTDLGSGNVIFVGSSCDMFSLRVSPEWIQRTIDHCVQFDNTYLFQSKNTYNMLKHLPSSMNAIVCTTVETNRWYPSIMRFSPTPQARVVSIVNAVFPIYVTIEPILDFDLDVFIRLLRSCHPTQVNIGADSGGNELPEPSSEKILALIDLLQEFTVISRKRNLERLGVVAR